MDKGMLWFDNDPKDSLDVKARRAATYFREKYGQTPTLCKVHPSMMPVEGAEYWVGLMEIRGDASMLPHHFWIGVNDTPEMEVAYDRRH